MLAGAQGRGVAGDALLNKSLAAYFVPFRSPTFKSLDHSDRAMDFAAQLWTHIFEVIDPRLIITIDRGTTERLSSILSRKLDTRSVTQRFPIGWSTYKAEILAFDSATKCRMVRFPHLSRFRVFGRPQSQANVDDIMRTVSNFLRDEPPLACRLTALLAFRSLAGLRPWLRAPLGQADGRTGGRNSYEKTSSPE